MEQSPSAGDVVVIQADASLNSEIGVDFATRIDQIVAGKHHRVILDCSHLAYLSSYGLGMVVMLHSKLAKAGGALKLAAVKPSVLHLFTLTRVDRVFDIQPDVDAARAAFTA